MPAPLLAACAAAALSLGLDAENGAFDGMSHSGTLLVLRNLGPTPCSVAGLPTLAFLDASGHPTGTQRQAPPGMHPGPVVLPVGVAPEAELTAPLRWVSNDVYDGHHCAAAASLSVTIAGSRLTAPLAATLCGPAGAPIPFEQPVLRPDPTVR